MIPDSGLECPEPPPETSVSAPLFDPVYPLYMAGRTAGLSSDDPVRSSSLKINTSWSLLDKAILLQCLAFEYCPDIDLVTESSGAPSVADFESSFFMDIGKKAVARNLHSGEQPTSARNIPDFIWIIHSTTTRGLVFPEGAVVYAVCHIVRVLP
nr:unnamed protein product [Spirometra erinaceieuropaei]